MRAPTDNLPQQTAPKLIQLIVRLCLGTNQTLSNGLLVTRESIVLQQRLSLKTSTPTPTKKHTATSSTLKVLHGNAVFMNLIRHRRLLSELEEILGEERKAARIAAAAGAS